MFARDDPAAKSDEQRPPKGNQTYPAIRQEDPEGQRHIKPGVIAGKRSEIIIRDLPVQEVLIVFLIFLIERHVKLDSRSFHQLISLEMICLLRENERPRQKDRLLKRFGG